MNRKQLTINFSWPSFERRAWHNWLPSRGNVVFTLLVIGLFFWAQRAGAIALTTTASTATINYQGRIADSAGNPLTETMPMTFRLYPVPTGGTPLWAETWTGGNSVAVSDGLFNVMLGSIEPDLAIIIQSNGELYLGIEIGNDSEMTPRVQLGSVPFAMQSLTVPDGSITTEKLAPDIEMGMTEESGDYDASILLFESSIGNPVANPSKVTFSYKRIGSIVFVEMPLMTLNLPGNPHVIGFSLPFPPANSNAGAAGGLTCCGHSDAGDLNGVMVNGSMQFRYKGTGFPSGFYRGGFWYIATTE